jgi:type IV pilus assembly protein PilV
MKISKYLLIFSYKRMKPMNRAFMIRIWKNREGFTLVEIMIAVFILTVALLGMAAVTTMVVKGNAYSRQATTASMLVKDKLEQLKNTNVASLAGGTDYRNADSSTGTAGALYTRTWTITPGATTTTIAVTVQWLSQGAARNVTGRTIVAN